MIERMRRRKEWKIKIGHFVGEKVKKWCETSWERKILKVLWDNRSDVGGRP